MKALTRSISVIEAVCLATTITIAVVSCKSSPTTQLHNARVVYTTALNTAIELRQGGHVSDAAYGQIEAARSRAAAHLADAETLIASSDAFDIQMYAFWAAMDMLHAQLEANEGGGP